MSAPEKGDWGFTSEPIHLSSKMQWSLHEEKDGFPSDSKCPSLSDFFASCTASCSRCLCFCCPSLTTKPEKFAGVGYLPPDQALGAVDGPDVQNVSGLSYKPVFQFPQDPRQFPVHPQIPFKPDKLKLRQPQLKHTPGGGNGKVEVPESPFPTAPYLRNYGPGMQSPMYLPIKEEPKGMGIGRRWRSKSPLNLRSSKKQPRKERSLSSLLTGGASARDDGEEDASEGKVDDRFLKVVETETISERKKQGRHGSLALERLTRHRPRIFSMRSQTEDHLSLQALRDSVKRRKHNKRAKTVGSSPSRKPNLNSVKLRRCQTPEYFLNGQSRPKTLSQKALALRRCKTPDILEHRWEDKERERHPSISPEKVDTIFESLNDSAIDAATTKEEEEGKEEEGEKDGEGERESEWPQREGTKQHSLIISTDGKQLKEKSPERERRKSPIPIKSPRASLALSGIVPITHRLSQSWVGERLEGEMIEREKGGQEEEGEGAEGRDAEAVPPVLHFSLYFDIQRRTLTINLNRAENLPHKHPAHDSCDPFIMMFLLPNKEDVLQSDVKSRTLNPKFNQTFEFGGLLANELKNQVLVFRIFDHDKFSKSDLIGTVIQPLRDADLFGVSMEREIDQRKGLLKQFSAGDLLFSLKYSPERQSLQGIILKATNLRKADIWGLADPYIKVYQIYKNKRVMKWKTSVKKNTLVPIYNENFQFDTTNMDIRHVSLEIWVMDYDWFSRNDKMGVVYIGLNSPQEVGRCHWVEIINSPEQMASHWHTIIPQSHLKHTNVPQRGKQSLQIGVGQRSSPRRSEEDSRQQELLRRKTTTL